MEFIFGVFIGALAIKVLTNIENHLLEKRIQAKLEKVMQEFRNTIVPARIEISQGCLYMYHRETDEFLAQGKTFSDLEEAARKKYPNKMFNVPQDELNFIEENHEKNR